MFWLTWPTDSRVINQRYGVNEVFDYTQWGLTGHEGIDIRAGRGAPVYAATDGIVASAYSGGNYGTQVRIKHEEGGQTYETIYAHLVRHMVFAGDLVLRGQVIGYADSTGNSTGNHLHFGLKKYGATASGETDQPSDFVDPTPHLVERGIPTVQRPTTRIEGLHDGAAWMKDNGVKGWAVHVHYSEDSFGDVPTFDFRSEEAAGVRVVVRLNYSYARGDGGRGTYPSAGKRDQFVRWCIATIRASHGVWGWVIGNETNNRAEWPSDTETITPQIVTDIVNRVWWGVRVSDRISPPALDPTNGIDFDPRQYWNQVIANLVPVEFFSLHGYSYGYQQPVDSSQRFGPPMAWQYYSFRMWQPLASALYWYQRAGAYPFRRVPILITETDHIYKNEYGGPFGWNAEHGGAWYRRAVDYVNRWNAGPGEQFVHALIMYRYDHDAWAVRGLPSVLNALK